MERMTNDEMAEMIAERNGNQRFCKNCDDCCQPYNSTDDCFKSAMEAMKWKDEQEIEFLQSLLFQSATQNIFGRINERIKLLKGE